MNNELKQFDYVLPKELIAQSPAVPRDSARLLVYERTKQIITDDVFSNLENHLTSDTTLVVNNSRVGKARLKFDQLEVFITKRLSPSTVQAIVYPGKKFRLGYKITLAKDVFANVLKVLDDGQRQLELSVELTDSKLDTYRRTPFPPYIRPDESLASYYQTVYASASNPGTSLAAPTAGLHFTTQGLNRIRRHHSVTEITLHVGLGTFMPVKEINLNSAKLHKEIFIIDSKAAKTLNDATHITAVGTTVARALESAIDQDGNFSVAASTTELFIRPGYQFKCVDSLITNFHLPKSSLLMLVGALVGVENMHYIYKHAIRNKYRFYSFGDAMLII